MWRLRLLGLKAHRLRADFKFVSHHATRVTTKAWIVRYILFCPPPFRRTTPPLTLANPLPPPFPQLIIFYEIRTSLFNLFHYPGFKWVQTVILRSGTCENVMTPWLIEKFTAFITLSVGSQYVLSKIWFR